VELKDIKLSEISQAQKAKYSMFSLSYAESRPKMMIVMIMGHECKRGTHFQNQQEGKKMVKKIKVYYM
jgi:hypothetical protein